MGKTVRGNKLLVFLHGKDDGNRKYHKKGGQNGRDQAYIYIHTAIGISRPVYQLGKTRTPANREVHNPQTPTDTHIIVVMPSNVRTRNHNVRIPKVGGLQRPTAKHSP